MWTLGSKVQEFDSTSLIDDMKKQHKKVKESRRSRSRRNLKQLLKNKINMRVKKYKIKERVRMYDGTYQTMDTKYVITLTIEEARQRGLIEE